MGRERGGAARGRRSIEFNTRKSCSMWAAVEYYFKQCEKTEPADKDSEIDR